MVQPGTVPLTGEVAPPNANDTFAVTDDKWNRGGYRPVATTAARDNITADRRKVGMEVYVIDIDKTYRLVGGITNSDWVEVVGGGGSGSETIQKIGNGQFRIDVRVDGAWIAPANCTISSVEADVGERGTDDGSVTNNKWDVNLNGITIFTTQGNRPTIAASAGGGEALAASGTPDVTAVVAGDRITVDTDSVANGSTKPTDFSIIIRVVY